jgi:glutamate-5-semialdehyde dehydrogenase
LWIAARNREREVLDGTLVSNDRSVPATERLERLEAGAAVPYGGNRVARVSPQLADAFRPGDELVVVQSTGHLLHIPAAEATLVREAVDQARGAFGELQRLPDAAVSEFFDAFARRLEDDAAFEAVAEANGTDVARARDAGRSTTRLVLSAAMRAGMVAGLRAWRDAPSGRDAVVDEVRHEGWRVEIRRAPLGVVGFVFEGRPNVFADACGVLRTGNTVVFRIGSDALGTARAIVEHALAPALAEAGLPAGAAVLLDTPSRAAGWALFGDRRLALAVARGSGAAVEQLGAVARQAGVPVSLHGTGGAWMVAGRAADADRFAAVVRHSLDRKVCNTLNVCCIVEERAVELVPRFLASLADAAAARGVPAKLHVAEGTEAWVPADWFDRRVPVARAGGAVDEPQAERIAVDELGREWEWEESPEASLVVIPSVADAVALCNRLSPRLVASLVSEDPDEQEDFYASVDTPFVGDGMTRWVDGQYALGKPELGLSNWESGRLFARSGVLSGDSVFTVRVRAVQSDPQLHR